MTPSMTPLAVFWDMDGTLIDSEPLHDHALSAALESLGITPPPDLHERILGLSARPVYELVRRELGVTLPFDDWILRKYTHYLAHAHTLQPRPGALDLFRDLEALGVPQAIVSNSDRIIVDANLRATGLLRAEMRSVSRNDVVRGKPDPEPFLRAAALVGVAPGACAVVEDSQTGAMAGVAAGMLTLFWPQAPLDAPEGAHFVASAAELRARLVPEPKATGFDEPGATGLDEPAATGVA